MVVPAPRDPDVTREILTRWLGDPARLPGARITDLRTPEFTGFSSEILMLDVEHLGRRGAGRAGGPAALPGLPGDPGSRSSTG